MRTSEVEAPTSREQCTKCGGEGQIKVSECTCGGIDIGVGAMHEPSCGYEQCEECGGKGWKESEDRRCGTCGWGIMYEYDRIQCTMLANCPASIEDRFTDPAQGTNCPGWKAADGVASKKTADACLQCKSCLEFTRVRNEIGIHTFKVVCEHSDCSGFGCACDKFERREEKK